MTIDQFLQDLLYVILAVGIPALITELVKLARSKVTGTKYESIWTAILNAVDNTNQTYVDDLKKSGQFDADAQKTAVEKSLSTAIELMGTQLYAWLGKITSNADEYIKSLIESAVKKTKLSTPTAVLTSSVETIESDKIRTSTGDVSSDTKLNG